MRAVTLSELPVWAQALLEATPVAHLGLLDEQGRPRVQPITFARVGEALWSAIDDKPKRAVPARVRRLRADPRATITVDHYEEDWTRLAWVQAVGTITVVDADADALAALQRRYPPYRERPPRGPFLRLQPTSVLCWSATPPNAPC